MVRNILLFTVLLIFCVLLQTTVFSYLSIFETRPDLALIVIVFMALYKGSNISQISGFLSGLVEDCLSLSPLGFHAFIRALTGFIIGLFKDKISVNTVVFPIVIIPLATLFKYCVSFVLSLIFTVKTDLSFFLSVKLPIEIGYNITVGLVIYFFIRLFSYPSDNISPRFRSGYDK